MEKRRPELGISAVDVSGHNRHVQRPESCLKTLKIAMPTFAELAASSKPSLESAA
jgi:hypothetical protein